MSLINDALKRAHQSLKKESPPDMSSAPESPTNEPEIPQNTEAQTPPPEAPPSEVPEMQPAFTESSGGGGVNAKGILVALVCVGICAGAAWGIWKYINSSPAKIAATPAKGSATNKLANAKPTPTTTVAKAPASTTTAPAKPLTNIVARTEAKLRAARAATGADDFDNEGKPIEKPAAKVTPPAEKQVALASKPVEKVAPPPVKADLAAVPAKLVEKPVQVAAAQAQPAPVEQPAAAPAKTAEKAQFPEVRLQGIFYRLSRPSAMLSGQTVYIGDSLKGSNVKVKAIDRQSVTLELEGETTVLTMR